MLTPRLNVGPARQQRKGGTATNGSGVASQVSIFRSWARRLLSWTKPCARLPVAISTIATALSVPTVKLAIVQRSVPVRIGCVKASLQHLDLDRSGVGRRGAP